MLEIVSCRRRFAPARERIRIGLLIRRRRAGLLLSRGLFFFRFVFLDFVSLWGSRRSCFGQVEDWTAVVAQVKFALTVCDEDMMGYENPIPEACRSQPNLNPQCAINHS